MTGQLLEQQLESPSRHLCGISPTPSHRGNSADLTLGTRSSALLIVLALASRSHWAIGADNCDQEFV